MFTADIERAEVEHKLTARDRVVNTCRRTMHLSHEARLLTSLASDALENVTRAAKRAMKHRLETLEDLKDEAVHRIKRQPVQTVSLALGLGVMIGLTSGWIARAAFRHDRSVSSIGSNHD